MKVYLTERQILDVLKLQENSYTKRCKKDLYLKEDGVSASLGNVNGVQAAKNKAAQLFNQNPSVTSTTSTAANISSTKTPNNAPKLQVPTGTTSSNLSKVEDFARKNSGDTGVEIEFTKGPVGESVSFTKKELDEFFKTL